MAFNTRCKFYNGLVGRKTHSTPFPTSLSLEKKGRKKKDCAICYVQCRSVQREISSNTCCFDMSCSITTAEQQYPQ